VLDDAESGSQPASGRVIRFVTRRFNHATRRPRSGVMTREVDTAWTF
jgi:hypothetical protein